MKKGKKVSNESYKSTTLIKCPKCNVKNVITADKCYSCNSVLPGNKSCPRCAKYNKKDADFCVSCGYKFKIKRKRNLLVSFLFSLLIVIILTVLVLTNNEDVVNNFNNIFRIILAILIFFMVLGIFNYGKKDKVDYDKMYNNNNDEFKGFRRYSYVVAVIGFSIVYAILMYLYFVK